MPTYEFLGFEIQAKLWKIKKNVITKLVFFIKNLTIQIFPYKI